MKKECAYAPVPAPIPKEGVWPSQLLARLCIPSRRSYLIPLGALQPGHYFLEVSVEAAPHIHAEIVTREFDLLLEEPLNFEAGIARSSFVSLEASEPFLRLLASEPVVVKRVVLGTQEAGTK